MRSIALSVLACTVGLLTACEGDAPAAKTPAKPAELAKTPEPVQPLVDVSTLPGAAASGDGVEYAAGVRGWTIVPGMGELLPTEPMTATIRLRGWTENGEQFFGDSESWDELVLPTGDGAAFGGWGAAMSDMKVGEVRKVWIGSDDRGTWPLSGKNPQNVVLDIELVSIGDSIPIPETLPGVAIGDAARHGSSSGLRWYDLAEGAGAALQDGDTATFTVVAWREDGTPWQDTGRMPVALTLDDALMPAMREGLVGMMPGSTRKLIVPAMLGAGFDPLGELPPGSTLIMDVQYVVRPVG